MSGLEPAAIAAISGIALPVFEKLWKTGGKVFGQVREGQQYAEEKGRVLQASREYHRKYEDRHGQMKIMPGLMKEPVPLDSIYTAVKFLDERSIRHFATADDLEKLYRNQGKRSFQTADKRHDGISIAKDKQYLMVLGGPGIGKSTFLRKLGLEALKGQQGQLKSEQIPVFLELKTFRDESIDLTAVIAKEFEICGFPDTEAFTSESLKQGKLLLLFDGLDEVPDHNMNRVIEQIEALAIQYDKNTFVASCRTAAYRSGFNRFSDVTIADFDDEQIDQFIQRWFNSGLDQESDTAKRYLKLLQQPQNNAAKELAQTPLLLTFLCLVYEREQTLPSKRSTLYERALNILLSEWSAQKRLERAPIYEDFHPDLEKVLLSEIAYTSFKEDRLFFSKSDITNRITSYLADTLDAPECLDGPAVLHAIEVQQGILVERATDIYSFSHLTLQEYLTARYVSKNNLIQELASEHLRDERWREVFLLVSGLLEERNKELFLVMGEKVNAFINSPKLQGLLQWATGLTESSLPSNQMLASRVWLLYSAIAIARDRARASSTSDIDIAIASDSASTSAGNIASARVSASARARDSDRYLARVIASASAIASDIASASDIARVNASTRANDIAKASGIDRAIASASARASDIASSSVIVKASAIDYVALSKKLEALKRQIPSDDATRTKWKSFADQLLETFLTFFRLDKELVTFSLKDAQALDNYLYATKLIIDCKNAAVRVSRKEWEAIESRLLTVPDEMKD